MELEVSGGQLWWAKPDPSAGREQSGRRPVLIISSENYNRVVDALVLVTPLTTKNRGWDNHIYINPRFGLAQDSWAMTEQVKAISRKCLEVLVGRVDSSTLEEARSWIRDFL